MKIEVTLKEKIGSKRVNKITYDLLDLLNNTMWDKERWEAVEVNIIEES